MSTNDLTKETKQQPMIQRIQSIFLLLAGAASGALFALPFGTAAEKSTKGVLADGIFNIHDHIGLLILTVAVTLIAVVSIFLYNNRVLQMNVGKLNLILAFGLLAWAAYQFVTLGDAISFGFGMVMPLIVVVLTYLANRYILKDEKLVKSADRIR